MLKLNYTQQRRLVIILFTAAPLILLCTFSFYPATQLFHLSLTDWNGFAPVKEYIGFENYMEFWWDPELLRPFLNSLYYFAGSLIQITLALWFAVILNSKLIGRNIFKTLIFMPFVLNAVAAAMVFQIFFQVDGGFDSFLRLIGLDGAVMMWLRDPDVVPWSLVAASVWRYLGFSLVLFFGVLQSIPSDQYEAARIEGASEWHQFRYITLPSIKMVIALQFLLNFVGSLSVFEIPYIITRGANGTKTFVMATVDEAFKFNNYGLASAMAVLLLVIVLFFMVFQKVVFSDRDSQA